MTSGQLQLRGADPFALENPTSISGTNTDGQLTDLELSTPAVTSVRDVPQYGTTATITAAFSMLQPGVGSITEEGNMTVQVKLAVDLHIVVPLLEGASDCHTEPVNLTLTSTAPYDTTTQRVTLRAANFSVPPVVASAACNGLLTDPVNEALAGAGHSLTLTLAGAITAPPEGEPTATTLAVSPAGSSTFGKDVTLTATVVPDPVVEGAPAVSGVVTFLDDGDPVGTADVEEDGTATLVTADLAAGPRQLQAVYGGAPPDWDPSESAVTPYTVIANPLTSTTAAGEVRIGGPGGKDFDVTVNNTDFGADLEDATLEVKINRQIGSAPIGPNGVTPRITLARIVDGTPTDIPLTFAASPAPASLNGTVGDADTWLLDVGEEHTEHLRLEVAAGTAIGPLTVTFTLVTGAGAEREVLSTSSGVISMVNEARTTVNIDAGNPGFPPAGILATPPVTPTVRQGNVAEVNSLRVTGTVSGVAATGTYTFTVDGVPTQAQHITPSLPNPYTWLDEAPVGPTSAIYLIKVPHTLSTGTHQVTVRYSGNGLYAPVQRTWPITIESAIGTVYECVGAGVGTDSTKFTANVEVQATLPTVWAAGQDLPVDRVQVKMRLSRTVPQENSLFSVITASEENRRWNLGLGPDGDITPSGLTRTNFTPIKVGDVAGPDHVVDATNGTGVLEASDTPGESTTYTLDEIELTAVTVGFSSGFVCTPVADPYVIGTVTWAGTTLTADPGAVVGEGSDVELTATALPAAPGVVEFRDGTTTIGVVPVDFAGVARMTTDDLPAGTRSLTARFFGGVVATAPSVPVELRVIGECGAFLDAGNGAVVRLVYMELLGRCPDAAGYDFWKGRLDGGTTPEAFARAIARSTEAVGMVVDDAYEMMLGRAPDAAGRAFWVGRLLGHGRYDQLLADLGASGEFWDLSGETNVGFVTRVYERLLDRAPDQGGLDFWVGRLGSGTSPRALVLSLANQDEPLGRLVTLSYDEILDRAPDSDERSAGIGHLRSTGDRSGLYAQLIGLGEFSTRAQTFPGTGD